MMRVDTSGVYGLILLHDGGLEYTNQTGGYACHHPIHIGSFLPFRQYFEEETADRLYEHFAGKDSEYGGWCEGGISETTADFLDKMFENIFIKNERLDFRSLKVDRSLLDHSEEAWVYTCLIDKDGQKMDAVFVWSNSD